MEQYPSINNNNQLILAKGGRCTNRFFVVDPRGKDMQKWNRVIVLARGVSLAVDPLYLLAICIRGGNDDGRRLHPCVFTDARVVLMASVVRTCVDVVHACHVAVRFRLAYVSRESLVVGCGKLVWDARAIAWNYLTTFEGFWFDAFVILPLPQVTYWLVVPMLLRQNRIEEMMAILQLLFLIQFIPKVYHCFSLMRAMRKATGIRRILVYTCSTAYRIVYHPTVRCKKLQFPVVLF